MHAAAYIRRHASITIVSRASPLTTVTAFNATQQNSLPDLYTVQRKTYSSEILSPSLTKCRMTSMYANHSTDELIARISDLEAQLRDQTAKVVTLRAEQAEIPPASSSKPAPSSQKIPPSRKPIKPFDPSSFSTRHIALKFSYIGARYQGYEHSNGNVQPKPAVEEVLWKALRKARLISPRIEEGADEGVKVVWDPEARKTTYFTNGWGDKRHDKTQKHKLRLDLSWEGCQYSKCGRTDRGVSAFGQVIGIRVRSNRPLSKSRTNSREIQRNGRSGHKGGGLSSLQRGEKLEREMPGIGADDLVADMHEPPFDHLKDELPYLSILNTILPPDIRVLAWCPDPPSNFDARFSCRERRYKYFFTNPAFCPTPGPLGMKHANDSPNMMRTGWLDIEKMREAAKKLEGLHDFRNLCKIDAGKQMPSCERRITFADIEEFAPMGVAFQSENALNSGQQHLENSVPQSIMNGLTSRQSFSPQIFAFAVHGSAFLWHQVRCMVAILFLVGQGLETPNVIDDLLNIQEVKGKPLYEMASEYPLVLWDCIFPDEEGGHEDCLNWIYVGDEATIPSIATKTDGKFGTGGLVDGLWEQWRKTKMDEILCGRLLDLTLGQGDRTPLHRGGLRISNAISSRSQKVFDGSESARMVGEYVSVMKRARMDDLQTLNVKYASGKQARRDAKTAVDVIDDGN